MLKMNFLNKLLSKNSFKKQIKTIEIRISMYNYIRILFNCNKKYIKFKVVE
jgi:hypothetical protein